MEMDSSETEAALSKMATEYVAPLKSLGVLEPFKDSILTLRAKTASYETITDLLTELDLKVSVSSVRRFCQRYQKQIKQISNGLKPKPNSRGATTPLDTLAILRTTTESLRSARDLRGPL